MVDDPTKVCDLYIPLETNIGMQMELYIHTRAIHMTASRGAIFAVFWPFHAQLLFFFDK